LHDFENVTGETTVWNLESIIRENTGMEMNGGLLEYEEVNLLGNLDDFAKEFHSPVRNFDIALEDSVENVIERMTIRNLESTIGENTGMERNGRFRA